MKNLKSKHGLPFLQLVDSRGATCVFLGGVYKPTSEKQYLELLESYSGLIEDATDDDGDPATLQEFKDYQATQMISNLSTDQNVSVSDTSSKIKPASTKTMEAITPGITPITPVIPKVVIASKK